MDLNADYDGDGPPHHGLMGARLLAALAEKTNLA